MGNLLFIFGVPVLAVAAVYLTAGPIWAVLAGGGIVVWFFYPTIKKKQREDAARKREAEDRERQRVVAEEAARWAEVAQAKERQRVLGETLQRAVTSALERQGRMADCLVAADESLERARHEFAERAFAPFWDQVAECVHRLASVNLDARGVVADANLHMDAARDFEGTIPPFPVNRLVVQREQEVAIKLEQDCAELTRAAQKDFQFATIFEQRKTNAILVEGFSTLSQAIGSLRASLLSSFEEVSSRLEALHESHDRHSAATADVATAIAHQTSAIASSMSNASSQRAHNADVQQRIAERQLAMLDNLQRRRRPLPDERGPRKF